MHKQICQPFVESTPLDSMAEREFVLGMALIGDDERASHRHILMKATIPEEKKATEHLANERTFLAWIRTCIAVISLGFVVTKFDVWLRELAKQIEPQAQYHSLGISLPLGITMMALGGLLAVLAAWHYHIVNNAIERGEVQANRGLVVVATIAVALLAALMIVYLVLTERRI